MPSLAACYNLMDFEAVARQVMKKTAWAYYSSGADDEIVCETLNQRPSRPCHHTDDILTISPTLDIARKPPRLPQDLVPPPRPR
jgi:hypothetical protein